MTKPLPLAWPFNQSKMFLVDDDTMTVPGVGSKGLAEFRVRIWRAAGLKPVVLASQIKGQAPPNWATNRIAQKVLTNLMSYSKDFVYFIAYDGSEQDKPVLVKVDVEYVGNEHRPSVENCKGVAHPWRCLSDLVGSIVQM